MDWDNSAQEKIYNVDLSGNKTIHQGGLTAIVDIAISPIDGAMYAIQHAEFGPPWLNNKGRLFRIQNGVVDTLLSEMPRPSALVFSSNGDLFISSFSDDNIVKVSNISVGVEDENNFTPNGFTLEQNYPNPFDPSTSIKYRVPSKDHLKLQNNGDKVASVVDLRTGKPVQFSDSGVLGLWGVKWDDVAAFGDKVFKVTLAGTP